MLERLINARFTSKRAFIRAVSKVGENVGQAYLAKILTGLHPPIIERAEAWADTLELAGDERQRFMDLAAISHLPVEVQPRFVTLLRQLQAAQAKIDVQNLTIDAKQAAIDALLARLHALERASDGIRQE